MKTILKRIFHPVGQGAFYSEKIFNFNIVYDCGTHKSLGQSEQATRCVKDYVSDKKPFDVDILFISHFHADHISHIKTLIDTLSSKGKKIKRVVLPKLTSNETKILLALYKEAGEAELYSLVQNPAVFFGKETIIYTISGYEEGGDGDGEIIISEENVEEESREVASGTAFTFLGKGKQTSFFRGQCIWKYIPYNRMSDDSYDYLRDELAKQDPKQGLNIDNILSNDSGLDLKTFTLLKSLYGRVQNQDSLVVYSGPTNDLNYFLKKEGHYINNLINTYYWHRFRCYEYEHKGSFGCVYTGDVKLGTSKPLEKGLDILKLYRDECENIITIQAPHHGAREDFKYADLKALAGKDVCFPICSGKTNTYGHPSPQTVSAILSLGGKPIIVSESPNSVFIEMIQVPSRYVIDEA